MWSKGHVRGILRDAEGRKPSVFQGVSGFQFFPEGGGCYTLPNQARYQTSLNPDGSDSGAGALGGAGNLRGYYIRFAWKMQPPFFGRRGCFTDGVVVFSDGRVVFFSAGKRSPPSPSPRGEGVAAGDGRGVVPNRSLLRRMQKRNENHLFRHPACGRRRMPPSPPGEGFCAQSVPTDAKTGRSPPPKSFPLRGRCRRRRRKRCRIGSQFLSTDAEAQRISPLPSSGLRGTPDATLPSRGGIFARQSVPASCGPCCCPCAISSWRRRPRSRSRRGG